jgi:HKD family nuclease
MKTNIKLLVTERGKIDIYLKNIYLNWCQINFLKELLNSPNCKEKKFQITKVLYKDPVILFCEQTQKSQIIAEIISVD